uniref:Guanine nucleotide exchange factor VAV2-like n=3 Tax=Hirondellea gigas TaxID=1518452 RepID=A0A6A7FQH3_9CRUS
MDLQMTSEVDQHMLKEWQECGKWLHRIGFIREDHKLNSTTCTVPDFALFFRDGVTLCKLLYHIDNTSIDMSSVSQRPHNAQFLCTKNIKKFLSCCVKHYGLREVDLFVAEQLFEFTDIKKLLRCLSKLSSCPKVLELLKTEGFHVTSHASDQEEKEINRSLQDMANHNPGLHTTNSSCERLSLATTTSSTFGSEAGAFGGGSSSVSHKSLPVGVPGNLSSFKNNVGGATTNSTPSAGGGGGSSFHNGGAPANVSMKNGECSSFSKRTCEELTADDCGLRALQQSIRGGAMSGGTSSRKRDDEVYQSLCYVTFKSQDGSSSGGGITTAGGKTTGKDKRECCMQELLETEKGYVKALNNIVRMFLEPLKKMLSPEHIETIFYKLVKLCQVHQSLLQALTEARTHSAPTHNSSSSSSSAQAAAVAQVFVRFQEQLLVYGEYCAHYQTAVALLDEVISSKPSVADKIKESEVDMSKDKHQLRDLLFVPVQRILKYQLLLCELQKHTAKNDAEYSQMKEAYECMVDLAQYVNEYKRDKETLKIFENLQASITDLPSDMANVKDLGRMRLDGQIRIECHPEKNKLRFVFLFDKAMIMCKQSKDEKYLYKDSVMLEGCKVDVGASSNWPSSSSTLGLPTATEFNSSIGGSGGSGGLFSGSNPATGGGGGTGGNPGGGSTSTSGKKSGGNNTFLLVVNGNKKAYTIIAKNEMERDKWLEAVTCAIDNVNPSENSTFDHQFVLSNFTEPNTKCSSCNKLLKGIIFRGYRCRECNVSCHRSCLRDLCLARSCQSWSNGSNNSNNRPPSFNRNSTTAITTCQASSPQLLLGPPVGMQQGEWGQFWQVEMRELPWWAERMCRDRAEEALITTRQGTFLMRWSDKHSQPVVSLKVATEVKHMRIHQEVNDGNLQFYFCRARNFLTLTELVNYYNLYPLSEAFQELDERLLHPIYDSAVAMFEYHGSISSNSNYLQLHPGQRLVVLGRQGQDRGWWSGRSGLQAGFFPRDFVKIDDPPKICRDAAAGEDDIVQAMFRQNLDG